MPETKVCVEFHLISQLIKKCVNTGILKFEDLEKCLSCIFILYCFVIKKVIRDKEIYKIFYFYRNRREEN